MTQRPSEGEPERTPQGPDATEVNTPRRRGVGWVAARVLALALLISGGLVSWLWWQEMERVLAGPMPTGSRSIQFTVEKGASLARVAAELESMQLLPTAHYLIIQARRADQAGSIKAGEYVIEPYMTPVELLDLLVSGRVVQRALTIVEGWTFRQLRAAIGEAELLEQTLADTPDEEIMARLGAPGQHPEGRFLAETYHFPAGTTDFQFLRRAYLSMIDVLAEEWATRAPDLPIESPDDALILASIIEKETAAAEERAQIAGVFVRRLRKRMRLQTDPTVIYGMGERYDGNIRRSDLREDTPYNTYVHHGLTPTPISMPGRAAIHAALNPQAGKTLFFVARGDGKHHFSETYAEHREAVIRFQLRGRKPRKRATEAAGSG